MNIAVIPYMANGVSAPDVLRDWQMVHVKEAIKKNEDGWEEPPSELKHGSKYLRNLDFYLNNQFLQQQVHRH